MLFYAFELFSKLIHILRSISDSPSYLPSCDKYRLILSSVNCLYIPPSQYFQKHTELFSLHVCLQCQNTSSSKAKFYHIYSFLYLKHFAKYLYIVADNYIFVELKKNQNSICTIEIRVVSSNSGLLSKHFLYA